MLDLESAIIHAEEVVDRCEVTDGDRACAEEHRQLAEWLKELAEIRKQPEIIFCKDCEKHNKRFDEYPADEACPLTVWRVAQEHEFDYQFCAYAERRTDG